jgi:hypothetical protein
MSVISMKKISMIYPVTRLRLLHKGAVPASVTRKENRPMNMIQKTAALNRIAAQRLVLRSL